MRAGHASAPGSAPETQQPEQPPRTQQTTLEIYLDRGPLGRAIGRLAPAGVPGEVLAVLGAVPLTVAWIARGTDLPDGVLAVLLGWAVVLGSFAGQRTEGRLGWLVPPLIRGLEYGTLIWLAACAAHAGIAGGASGETQAFAGRAVAAAFLLLAVLAFRHYDTVYRLQYQKAAPPSWVGLVGGGWELRVLIALGLFLGGALAPGYLIAALVLGAIYVTESVLSWLRLHRAVGNLGPAHTDDDREE
jgi:hypothetical protein